MWEGEGANQAGGRGGYANQNRGGSMCVTEGGGMGCARVPRYNFLIVGSVEVTPNRSLSPTQFSPELIYIKPANCMHTHIFQKRKTVLKKERSK